MEKAGDTSGSKEVFDKKDNPSFFYKNPRKPPFVTASEAYEEEPQTFSQTQLNRILVFRHIEKTEPTTRYKISKETGLDKTTVRLIVRDLVFAGIVHEKNVLQDNGKMMKILSVPKEVENEIQMR